MSGGKEFFGQEKHFITTGVEELRGAYGESSDFLEYEVDPSTVGQFTGLVDKNGVRIFEGDIVSSEYGKPTAVEWFRGRFLPFNAYPEYKCWHEDDTEVTGNIHDHPSLLQG